MFFYELKVLQLLMTLHLAIHIKIILYEHLVLNKKFNVLLYEV